MGVSALKFSAITYSIIAPLVLGFAAVGLYLIYLAYRYNLLFVFNADVDTKGLVYARALQQTTTGCYLGIVCLIGLFAVQSAPGPLILMVIFLVFVILWHLSLNAAIDPLLSFLPKSLQVEEESLLSSENPENTQGHTNDNKEASTQETTISSPTSNKPNTSVRQPTFLRRPTFSQTPTLLTRFLFPTKHCDWHYFRRKIPHSFLNTAYEPHIESNAYHHPAIKSETPLLWVPRDPLGVSGQECRHTGRVVRMTDEGAGFDGKGRMVWEHEGGAGMPPIHEEKIYF